MKYWDNYGLVVTDYDAQTVKHWIRGVLDLMPGDMQETTSFLLNAMADDDVIIARGIWNGRRILLVEGETPQMLTPKNDTSKQTTKP